METSYHAGEFEPKWQDRWAEDRLYQVNEESDRPKWYALTMFPYTSGNLHIGHWYAMAPSDVHARFKRMQGYNVIHPMGFDAFGLPAENAAIKRGIHPFKWTMQNVENMRRQLKSMGAIYDWSREVVTCLPEYYQWTQWFFLKLYQAGLAYRGEAPVNWCPDCQTVLANEQVVDDGVCERCGTPVVHRDLEQWFFRITKYADELEQHDGVDWPERIKIMQRNWVGKSQGTEISFGFEHPDVGEKENGFDFTYVNANGKKLGYHNYFADLTADILSGPIEISAVEDYYIADSRQAKSEMVNLGSMKLHLFK